MNLRMPLYLSLLLSGTLHSVKYIFPFLPCLLLLFFLHLFLRSPQTTTLPSLILFPLQWFLSLPSVCYEPVFIILQALGLPES